MQMQLSFHGATRNVTGSRYLLEANGCKILIDCGLFQEWKLKARNWDPFPVPPAEIDAVLLTHAHLDHCGLLPKLHKEGFDGPIYCTPATADIATIVILDSASLQVEDAERKQRRHRHQKRTPAHPVLPLYTVPDAESTRTLFETTGYGQPVQVGDGIEAVFHDAGHILGSSSIEVRVTQNGVTRSIVFSGDVGRYDVPIVNDPAVIESADYMVTESTYGDRLHGPTSDIPSQLARIVNDTKAAGGNVIIPSFAVERSQELLFHLSGLLADDLIPHIRVFLDSPMAVKVTEVFRKHRELFDEEMVELMETGSSPFNFDGLKFTRTAAQSKAINKIKGTPQTKYYWNTDPSHFN